MNTHHANTYDLLLASESDDKGRSVVEMVIYALFILSVVAAIVTAAAQPIIVPSRIASKDCKVEYCA
jgi:hypothetical protein